MIRNLLIISGAGLLLALVGIGGSLAVGGSDLARHSWTWVISDHDDGSFNIQRTEASPTVTRDIAWVATDKLTISLPGKVTYIQDASAPAITITGPQPLVDRVTFIDGQLLMKSPSTGDAAYIGLSRNGVSSWTVQDALRVTINAATVKAFNLQGDTDLEVRAYNQPSLDLVMTGSAEIKVQGSAPSIRIDGSGSSSADLAELLSNDATINLSGSADVETAANGMVAVDASGNSYVKLTRRPMELRQTLAGEADVRQD